MKPLTKENCQGLGLFLPRLVCLGLFLPRLVCLGLFLPRLVCLGLFLPRLVCLGQFLPRLVCLGLFLPRLVCLGLFLPRLVCLGLFLPRLVCLGQFLPRLVCLGLSLRGCRLSGRWLPFSLAAWGRCSWFCLRRGAGRFGRSAHTAPLVAAVQPDAAPAAGDGRVNRPVTAGRVDSTALAPWRHPADGSRFRTYTKPVSRRLCGFLHPC